MLKRQRGFMVIDQVIGVAIIFTFLGTIISKIQGDPDSFKISAALNVERAKELELNTRSSAVRFDTYLISNVSREGGHVRVISSTGDNFDFVWDDSLKPNMSFEVRQLPDDKQVLCVYERCSPLI